MKDDVRRWCDGIQVGMEHPTAKRLHHKRMRTSCTKFFIMCLQRFTRCTSACIRNTLIADQTHTAKFTHHNWISLYITSNTQKNIICDTSFCKEFKADAPEIQHRKAFRQYQKKNAIETSRDDGGCCRCLCAVDDVFADGLRPNDGYMNRPSCYNRK